ncbi:right-handed parallel beta-helix repeat-containing protein [Chengkuizengella marina]|uniref:right-handed parallel beta-helix repeat-containing protein n=1 Tax=Chengkuizengella marina TaxID=2507566 RepID=UPI00136BC185|nr:right-handed parallel beta-helix repeat-containing protein [Chengkuizengella marina]
MKKITINNIIKNNEVRGIRIEDENTPSGDFNIIDNNIITNNKGTGIFSGSGTNNNAVRSNCLFNNALDIDDQGTDNIFDEN